MKVSFDTPYLDRNKGGHIFIFQDPPLFEYTQDATTPFEVPISTDCSGQFLEFCDSFLKEATQFFSKPLPVMLFLDRLSHEWSIEEIPAEEREFSGKAVMRWIPASVCFLKGRYIMEWSCIEIVPETIPVQGDPIQEEAPNQEIQEVQAAVPFVEPEAPALPPPQPQEQPQLQNLPIQPEVTFRERWKQKVRKARLRVTLAQLRAERMAEQYYLHYGSMNLEDSDSDISYSEFPES